MMFRENNGKLRNTVQCIRTYYDKIKKRSAQKVIASFDPFEFEIPVDELNKLNDSERAEALVWHSEFKARTTAQRLGEMPSKVIGTIGELVSALESKDASLALKGMDSGAMYAAIDELVASMRRHKLSKTQKASNTSKVSESNEDATVEGNAA